MLAPRFTLRAGLIALTAGSFLAVALREAMQGVPWAIGVSIAVGAAVLSLVLQAITFGLSLAFSRREDGGAEP